MNKLLFASAIVIASLFKAQDSNCTASHYGKNYKGTITASGKRLNQSQFTVAHKTLKFGTKIEILNIKTGVKHIATVTDRGPFVKGRCLDLTTTLFEALGGNLKQGLMKVDYKILK